MITVDLPGLAQVITALGVILNIYLSYKARKDIEVVRHATNSLLDARVTAAKSEGAQAERDRPERGVPKTDT